MPAVASASPEPAVRGAWLLRRLDGLFNRGDALIQRVLPASLNPLAQSGALAFASLIIAVVTGVVLVFWYKASAVQAHASLEAIRGLTLGQVVRSLHRYSSDACMAFTLLHALRLLAARRFGGARWLAWVTGAVLVALLWFIGWLGYWLVWDQSARQVALGTARLVDRLPIFAEPFSMAFLMDRTVRPLLFFVVFFLHMLLPLAVALAAWLHLSRLVKPRYWPSRKLLLWLGGAMLLLALVLPAVSGPAARMGEVPRALVVDAWYLAPLWLLERLSTGWIWIALLAGGIVTLGLPWLLPRRRQVAATIVTSRCNDCKQCAKDCPYDAITMVPRDDGRPFAAMAQVDPSKCVGCGICVGSCDTAGTDVPALPVLDTRHRMDAWLEGSQSPLVLFVCATSAGAALEVDPATGLAPELPGWRVLGLPCIGWLHPLFIERAFRHGARGVLVVGCNPGEPTYRAGGELVQLRLAGSREPRLRSDKIPAGKLRVLELPRSESGALLAACRDFERDQAPSAPRRSRARRTAVAVGLSAALTAAVAVATVVPYRARADAGQPALVVAFVHPGQSLDRCRKVSEEELAKLPPHMRQPEVCERGRVPVRLRITVDGQVVHQESYGPRGLYSDGASVAQTRLALSPGTHQVTIDVGDGADPAAWEHTFQRSLTFSPWRVVAVRFDRNEGFTTD